MMGAIGDVDLILFVVEAGSFTLADAKVLLSLFKPGIPTLLIANKLDHRTAAPRSRRGCAICRSATLR